MNKRYTNKGKERRRGHEKRRPENYRQNPETPKTSFLRTSDETIRLNKYIADAGICSRREADKLIEAGVISVNGEVVTRLGTKVLPSDKVQYGEQTLNREKLRYVLLNKPKDMITTMNDPQGRKTVMSLVQNACPERIFPVGRLDRNTTGLLLFTNDGDLAKKLTHPSHRLKKIYHVILDKPLLKNDLIAIGNGVELEEGFVKVDAVSWDENTDSKKEVGIELHSGQNRVVRRIFEKFGYDVQRLDRVKFGPLTKKDLPRGKWRFLTEKELLILKKF
jgi:23S rRNA pseudouridine2605 synthase